MILKVPRVWVKTASTFEKRKKLDVGRFNEKRQCIRTLTFLGHCSSHPNGAQWRRSALGAVPVQKNLPYQWVVFIGIFHLVVDAV
jgi:hypothetical protein